MSIPVFHMKIFKPGTQVWHQGRPYTVDHVSINGWNLKVSLCDYPTAINADQLECEYTKIDFNRQNT